MWSDVFVHTITTITLDAPAGGAAVTVCGRSGSGTGRANWEERMNQRMLGSLLVSTMLAGFETGVAVQ